MEHSIHTGLGLNAPEEARRRLQEKRLVLPSHENIALWTRGMNDRVLDCIGLQWLYCLEQLSFALVSLQVYSERFPDFETSEYAKLPEELKALYTSIVDIFEKSVNSDMANFNSELPAEILEKLEAIRKRREKQTFMHMSEKLSEFDQHTRNHAHDYREQESEVTRRMARIESYAKQQFLVRLHHLYFRDEVAYRESNLFAVHSLHKAIGTGDLHQAEQVRVQVPGLESIDASELDRFLSEIERRVARKMLMGTN